MEERTQLERTLKPHWVWAIALGSAIGWGAFILPIDWMATAGPLGAILGLGIGGLLMLIIAVSYGFMIQNFPVSGGEFTYAYVGFGRNHAFAAGWFLTLGYICIVALNASALALGSRFVLPFIAEQGYMYSIAGWDVYFGEVAIASLALIFFAWLNIRGVTLSGRLQFIFVMILISGIALVALGVLLHPSTPWSNLGPGLAPGTAAVPAILAMVAIAPWAYVGFDNVPQAAEEFNFSPQKAFGLIVFAIVVAALLYSTTIFATALAAPWQETLASEPVWGTADAVSGLFGGLGITVLFIALCMGVFTGLNGFYVSSSRLLFAMGRAEILPKFFGKVHPTHHTPYAGIILTCAVCLIAPWFGREALLWVVNMSAVGVTIAYFYTCFVAYRLFRWSSSDSSAMSSYTEGVVSPVKKVLSLIGAICGVGFLALLLLPFSPAALTTPSWIALIIWGVLGVVFYVLRAGKMNQMSKSRMDHLILGTDTSVSSSSGSGSQRGGQRVK